MERKKYNHPFVEELLLELTPVTTAYVACVTEGASQPFLCRRSLAL